MRQCRNRPWLGARGLSRDHWLGDQIALEAIIRLTDEELKHQELFGRIELLTSADMPPGYRFDIDANEVARFVLGKRTWAVLALTCHIELFSQAHYRASIGVAEHLSPRFKDVFLFHWKEESQHASRRARVAARRPQAPTPSATPASRT